MCYNSVLRGATMQVKQQIQVLLAQVETLLQEAQCEGQQLAEQECFAEVDTALSTLAQTVDYYVD
jgi:hypothetical protein